MSSLPNLHVIFNIDEVLEEVSEDDIPEMLAQKLQEEK